MLSLGDAPPAKARLEDDPEAADRLIREGARATPVRVHELEERLARTASDLEARLLLLGYYGRGGGEAGPSGEPYDTLIMGLFEQHPRSVLAGELGSSDASFERRASFWRKLVAANPRDAKIAGNAGAYFAGGFVVDDERKSEGTRLLERAAALDPSDPRWPWLLGIGRWVDAIGGDGPFEESKAAARQALSLMERSLELARPSPPRWLVPRILGAYERLTEMAWIAGEWSRMRAYASFALDVARSWGVDWERADVVNTVETLLGYGDLASGRLDEAERHLVTSARIPTSPVLESYGPDLGLAAELVARGRTQRVLEYLELCKGFWDPGPGVIDGWELTIRSGGTPDFTGHFHRAARAALTQAVRN